MRDHWCRGCCHLVAVDLNFTCQDCGSQSTGLATHHLILSPNEHSGRGKTSEAQHDTLRQTQYPLHYRLARGFAIMNGGSI